MNEELLQIIRSMEAAGEPKERIALVVQTYMANQQKKNQIQTAPAQPQEGMASPSEAGSLESSTIQPISEYKPDRSKDLGFIQSFTQGGRFTGATPVEEKKDKSELYRTSVMGGISRLNETIASIPEGLYNIAALPQQGVAYLFDKPEWEVSSDKFKETYGIKNNVLDYYKNETAKIQERKDKYIQENYQSGSITENIKQGNLSDAFDLLGAGVIESAPISLAIMASGGTVGAARTAIGATVAFTEGERQELKKLFPDASEAEIGVKAVMSAAAESVFESLGTGTIGAVYKDIILNQGKEQGTKIFRDNLIEMYKKILKNPKYGALGGAAMEGIEEAATQITQNLIKEKPVMEGVSDAFLIGMASGGAMTAPAQIQSYQDYTNKKRIERLISQTQQETPAQPEAQPVPEGAPIELNIPPAPATPEAPIRPAQEKVADVINRPVTLTELGGSPLETPIEGDMYVEGQQVVVEDANGNITEIGNVDEISNNTLEELGIKPMESQIKVTNKGNIQFGEDILVPDRKGIKRDKRGNISRVVLRNEQGDRTVTLRGANAEEAAYQILLREAQSPEQAERINQLLEQDEEFQNEFRQTPTAPQEQADKDTQQVIEQRQATEYSTRLNQAIKSDPDQYWSVDPVTPEQAMGSTIVMTEDGGLIVTEDGDMKGLFKDPNSKAKGVAADLLKKGVEAGGRKGDNFDGYLTEIYKRFGFRVTGRVPFNEEYAPVGWNKAKHGTPDVVAIVYDPQSKLDITEKTFDNYNDMIADRDSYLQEQPSVEQEVSKLEQLLKPNVDKQIENAKRALSKIAPNIEFILPANEQEYRRLTNETEGQESAGTYQNGKIYINPAKANARTVAHETFHAILLFRGFSDAQAKAVTERMLAAVKKTASPELLAELEAFSNQYDTALQSEESIAELVGILASNYDTLSKPTKNLIKRWLDQLAKIFGLKQFTDNEIIDLLNTISGKVATGQVLTNQDIKALSEGFSTYVTEPTIINRNQKTGNKVKVSDTPSELSFVTSNDVIDINALVDEIASKGQKVWFWVADQLGRGIYLDGKTGNKHYLDAGPSYALDPQNRKDNIIWATGKTEAEVTKLISQSDYIFIMSGSPTRSKMFNKKIINILSDRVGDFNAFKKGILNSKPTKQIKDVIEKYNNWESLIESPDRKKLLTAIEDVKSKKNTPLKSFLEKNNAFINMESLRDGFYAQNDFKMNDIMLVLKPTGVGGKSKHSTYENDILGEVIGVPDTKINAFDLMPKEIKDKYSETITESQKTQAVAPYGLGVKKISSLASRKQLAPNGKPSNLTKEQYKIVRTPEFKKWFGDWENNPENASKIVDENGEPLVLYHGSPAVDIDQFDRQKSIRISSGLKEFGTYFSTNKKLADIYSKVDRSKKYEESIIKTIFDLENKLKQTRSPKEYNEIQNYINELRQKGKIYPVFINLRNVEEFDAKGKDFRGWSELKVDASYKTATDRDAMEFLMDGKFGVEKKQGVVAKNIADGIFSSKEAINQHMGDVVLVFENQSNAVKLADGTNKTFNANNPSIRKQSQNINTIINVARQNNISDQAIKQYLKQQGFTDQQINDAFNSTTVSQQKGQRLKDIGKQSRDYFKRNRTKAEIARGIFYKIMEESVDRQAMAKRLIRKAGLKTANAFLVANAGASASAKNIADNAYNKIMKGLSNEEIKRLEEIIFARRVRAIDENRASRLADATTKYNNIKDELAELKKKKIKDRTDEDKAKINEYNRIEERFNELSKTIKHPRGYTTQKAIEDLDAYKQELGEKVYNELIKRSDLYFDEYKSILKKMKDEGLINQNTYETLAEINYQPRQVLNFMEDIHGDFLAQEQRSAESISLSQEQIKSLKSGTDNLLNMDAFGILSASILTRSHAVFNNRLNNVFADEYQKRLEEVQKLKDKKNLTKEEQKELDDFALLEENVRLDETTINPETGKPEFKLSSENTKGWSPIYYYKDGVKNRIWLKDKFHKQYTDTNNQHLNSNVKEAIGIVSGTKAVKLLATGKNPVFFLTNTPRDFLFVLNFSPEYGNELISNSIKLSRDIYKGVKDVTSNSKNFQKFLEYGGGMDFLVVQGRLRDGNIVKKGLDKVLQQKTQDKILRNAFFNFLDKLNLSSEVGIRMAVFNRSIQNQLKERGESDINKLSKEEQDLIYTYAVNSARKLTDFNQGGRTSKMLDAGLPYLNAAIQGTRAAASSIKERPMEATIRIMQTVAYTTGMVVSGAFAAIAAFRDDEDEEVNKMTTAEIYFETLRLVSDYDLDNYFIVPLGTRDDKGNWKYLRVAKSQALTPFINSTEYMVRKKLAEEYEIEYKQDLGDIVTRTIETNILPLQPDFVKTATRVPFVDAAFASSGIDSYTGNPLSWDRGKIPEQLEGIVDDRVAPAYKELGKLLGKSPVRLQNAVESFITTPSTNPYIGIAYALGDVTFGDKESGSLVGGLEKIGSATMKRLIKSTSEYNEIAKAKERVSDDVLDIYRKHIETEKKVKDAVKKAKRTGEEQEALKALEDVYRNTPELMDKATRWFKSEVNNKRLTPFASSFRFQDNKEVKAIILADRFGSKLLKSNPDFTEQERKIVNELVNEKIIDSETYQLYRELFEK